MKGNGLNTIKKKLKNTTWNNRKKGRTIGRVKWLASNVIYNVRKVQLHSRPKTSFEGKKAPSERPRPSFRIMDGAQIWVMQLKIPIRVLLCSGVKSSSTKPSVAPHPQCFDLLCFKHFQCLFIRHNTSKVLSV